MRRPSLKRAFRAEYAALKNAVDRCTRKNHPQYSDYGGRGIAVDPMFTDEVTGFITFLAAVGPKIDPSFTLERKCNQSGYLPGNLEWVPRSQNQLNRRKQKAACRDLGWGVGYFEQVRRDGKRAKHQSPLYTAEGRTQTIKHWSEERGLSAATITQRILRGWSEAEVLNPLLMNPRGKPRKDQTIH